MSGWIIFYIALTVNSFIVVSIASLTTSAMILINFLTEDPKEDKEKNEGK